MNPRLLLIGGAVLLTSVALAQTFTGSEGEVQTRNVTVGNAVTLGESSTSAIRTPVPCAVGPTSRYLALANDNTRALTRYPDGGPYSFGRRTSVLVENEDDKDRLHCAPGPLDAGTAPNCSTPGWGNIIWPNGGSAHYEISELTELWCVACGGDVTMEVTESRCEP